MKAIIWQGDMRFESGEVTKPSPGENQVLIKVEAASICTTDLHYKDFNCVPPIVPGHELSGTIVEVGRSVDKTNIGRNVAVDPVQRCGNCKMCIGGLPHLCFNVRHLGNTDIPGGWGQYIAVDVANTYDIPKGVTFAQAALTEPAAVCMESFKRANFKNGQSILVLGDGVFGLLHAVFAKIYGAKKIIVAGHYEERLRRIQEMSGSVICNTYNSDILEVLGSQVEEGGVNLVIEATGATKVPNIGLSSLRPRGTLVLFSYIWHPEILNLGLVHMKELNVLGSCRSLDCFNPCLEMMADGRLDTKSLIDLEVPLESCPDAIKTLQEKKKDIFKVVLRCSS